MTNRKRNLKQIALAYFRSVELLGNKINWSALCGNLTLIITGHLGKAMLNKPMRLSLKLSVIKKLLCVTVLA